jgi:thioredoxin-related protein
LGTVTYPDPQVAALLNDNFVAVQVDFDAAAKLVKEFQAIWTPNLNVLDGNRNRVYRLEGWLPPAEFTAMLGVARGQYFLRGKKYDQAEPLFKAVFNQNPRSQFAPEALY